MNLSGFNKMLAVGLTLLFIFPAAFVPGETPGAGTARREGRALPDHNRGILINDFSGMQMSGLANLTGGGLGLQLGAGAWRPEFPVDPLPGKQKEYPVIAANSRNELIITWEDWRNGGNNNDIYAQRFDQRGNPLGGAIAVCTAPNDQMTPCIATDPQDNFIIAWEDNRIAMSSDVYAQRFDRNGTKIGSEIMVSTSGTTGQVRIAVNGAGDSLIVWFDSRNKWTTWDDIYAQMLDGNGIKKGTEIPVSTAPENQSEPSVASDTKNRFIVTWMDHRLQSRVNIYAQRIDANGNKVGSEIAVSNIDIFQFYPVVATYPNDDFIVGWSDRRNSAADVFAQRFDQNATPLGSEMSATLSQADKSNAVIAVNSSSYAFIAWMDWTTGGDIYGQWFDPGGNQFGPEIIITSATNQQREPAIAEDPKGDIAVAWLDLRSGTTMEVYARQLAYPYQTPGTLTTGDLSGTNVWAWSSVAANASLQNASGNTVSFELSTDSGVTWQAVPANGSLSAAGAAPKVRIRATLATTDDMSTPVLNSLTVSYISNLAPVAALAATPGSALVGQQVQFNASASSDPEGGILSYDFSFGDGNDSGWVSSPVLLHAYAVAGNYSAYVTVKDDLGAGNSSIAQISVVRPIIPTLAVTNPLEGQLVNTTTLVVTFTVADYTITQTGGHIHYQLDSAGEVMWFSTAPFNITGLTEGSHVLKVYLANANHTRLPNPESYVIVNFTVGNLPQFPDLSISSTDIKLKPSSPKDGDSVTLSVTVHNTGTADAGAFTVRFFVDGTALPDQDVVILAKGGSKVVEAKWKAKSGSHNISVQVNPGGGLSESSVSNNVASVKLSVAKAEAGGASMLLIGVVILIIIIVVVALAVMMMRRKPTTVIPYQPPAQAPPPLATQPYSPPVQGSQGPASVPPPIQSPPTQGSPQPPPPQGPPAQTQPPTGQG